MGFNLVVCLHRIVIESAIGPDELEPNNDRIDESFDVGSILTRFILFYFIDDRASIKPE